VYWTVGENFPKNTKIRRTYTWKAVFQNFPIVWPQNCPNKRLPCTQSPGFQRNSTTQRVIHKVTCLHPVFGPAFTPYPLFQWYRQTKEILLILSMKCWNSAFNAQGSRLIIVIVQVGAVKIYVASLLRKKQIRDENQFTTKIAGKTNLGVVFIPSYIHVWCPIMLKPTVLAP
jgi:hypothetical protein